jgi:peptide/nickel transport system permease protein
MQYLILPAVTMSVIPMGIVARTVRALVADILAQEFVTGCGPRGWATVGVFAHVVKNAAPTALAVMGLQLGYLLGGSILIETVFSWPGTGVPAQYRDLPARPAAAAGHDPRARHVLRLPQPLVDVAQTMLDPRIQRG